MCRLIYRLAFLKAPSGFLIRTRTNGRHPPVIQRVGHADRVSNFAAQFDGLIEIGSGCFEVLTTEENGVTEEGEGGSQIALVIQRAPQRNALFEYRPRPRNVVQKQRR